MTLSFHSTEAPTGIEIRDHVEQRLYGLSTPNPVSPTPIETDQFLFPVDDAVSIRATSLTLPELVATYLRDDDGKLCAEIVDGIHREFPDGTYYLELCAPMKLYLVIDGAISVSATTDRFRFEFDTETDIRIGARSHHEQPAATITTTNDPRDMMVALSALSLIHI